MNVNNPNLERECEDFVKEIMDFSEYELERKAKQLYGKAEREFFNNRMSLWEYEERLRKIDEYVKIWTKRNAAAKSEK
jgi:hypothetical protein